MNPPVHPQLRRPAFPVWAWIGLGFVLGITAMICYLYAIGAISVYRRHGSSGSVRVLQRAQGPRDLSRLSI